jgi:beta-galactosidase
LEIPFAEPDPKPGAEYWLRLSVHEKLARPWCEAGFEIAKQQFKLPAKQQFKLPYASDAFTFAPPLAAPMVIEGDREISVSGESFIVAFHRASGELWHYRLDDRELLKRPLRMNFWRPQTDNDGRGGKTHVHQRFWRELAGKLKTDTAKVQKLEDSCVRVSFRRRHGRQVVIDIEYTIRGDGQVRVKTAVQADPALPTLVRLGMQLGITGDYSQIQYYGKGPWENYCDRNRGAEVDVYESAIAEMPENYVMPQENGNRTETRWLKLSGEAPAIVIEGDPPFGFSIWPWSAENLEEAQHTYDLVPQGFWTLNIDHRQMGVGGTDSWSPKAMPIEQYRIPSGEFRWEFTIRPERQSR